MSRKKQSLKDRNAAIFMAGCHGNQYTESLADRFVEAGFIVVPDPETLERIWINEELRKYLQRIRKFRDTNDIGKLDFANYIEKTEVVADDGTIRIVRNQYYKNVEESTKDEALQHMNSIDKNCRHWRTERRHYYRIYSRIHGPEFQLAFEFELDAV